MRFERPGTSVALAILGVCVSVAPAASDWRVFPFRWSGSAERVLVGDFDANGLQDLALQSRDGFRLFLHRVEGFRFAEGDGSLGAEGAALYDFADLSGNGRVEIVLYDARRGARAVAFASKEAAETLASPPRPFAPQGLRRARLVHDLDGDGDGDLALPGTNEVFLYFREPDGRYAPGGALALETEVSCSFGEGDDATVELRSRWSLPSFDLLDLDGDGRRDLVAEAEGGVVFYLAGRDGTFPGNPTFRLDLEALRRSIAAPEEGRPLNPSNLVEGVSRRVDHAQADLDGDGATDFVVRAGNRITVFPAGPRGPDFEKPSQVLKASGNLLGFLLEDGDGDGRLDLVLFRMEDVSLADALLWFVVPARLHFDVYTYRNRDGRSFSRTPDRRERFVVALPAVTKLQEEARRLFPEETGPREATARADLDGDGRADDLVVAEPSGRLRGFADAVEPEPPAPTTARGLLVEFLRALGWGRSEKAEAEVTLETLAGFLRRDAIPWRERTEGRAPLFDFDLGESGSASPTVWTADLDGDGREDAIVAWKEGGTLHGGVVLSRPR